MLSKRSNQVLLAFVTLVVIVIAVYYFFFAGSGYVEGRPTFMYFRLPT